MTIDPETMQIVVFVVGGIVFYRLTELLVDTVYRKVSGDCYVSKSSHEQCKAADVAAAKELRDELTVMRGILLVVAVKVGVDDRDLKRLAE